MGGLWLSCRRGRGPTTTEIRSRSALGAVDTRLTMMKVIAERVAAGDTVSFRPTGSSMVPLIRSRQLVTVAPCDPAKVEVGDIVLAKVAGSVYLHLVSAVDHARGRVRISNNRGRINGWTNYARVYGICTAVDGNLRSGTEDKTL